MDPPTPEEARDFARVETLAAFHQELAASRDAQAVGQALAENLAALTSAAARVAIAGPGSVEQRAEPPGAVPDPEPDQTLALTVGPRRHGDARAQLQATHVTAADRAAAHVATVCAAHRIHHLGGHAPNPGAAVVSLLQALQVQDRGTHDHSHRTAAYARMILRALGADPGGPAFHSTIRGALLHDIGKVAMPDGVLLKRGVLRPKGKELMGEHANLSQQILQAVPGLEQATEIAGQHHERVDGQGYPHNLGGGGLHLGARLVSVADAYDAMTSNRPYRPAVTSPQARAELADGVGSQFDHEAVETMHRVGPKPDRDERAA